MEAAYLFYANSLGGTPLLQVGSLENLIAEQWVVVGVVAEEALDLICGFGAMVATEECARPITGEEDIARTLHFAKLLQATVNIFAGLALARVVVEYCEH